jgi:2,4-dienoyl-CoA reductase-like NADH-dependent reductase (Old Yellow Enzyme family)
MAAPPMARPLMFDPVTLDTLTVRNRIVHSPFIEFQAQRDGTVSAPMMDYYTTMAREGVGLVIIESAYVAQQGRAHVNQLGINTERHLDSLARLVKAIHAEGAAVGVRLAHAGARTSELICGEQPIGPSIINFGKDFDVSREFDEGDVEELVLFFVHAAERAEEAGADLIEINGGQQYLLDQCVSSRYNTRYDDYGGTIEQRMHLPVSVIKEIKKRVSARIPISYLFSIHDKLEDGFTDDDLRGMVKALASARTDLYHPVSIHVLNKFFETDETLIEWVAKHSRKPIIAEGNIKSPQILKETLALGKAQLFALDKVLFSRPHWYSFLQKKVIPQP